MNPATQKTAASTQINHEPKVESKGLLGPNEDISLDDLSKIDFNQGKSKELLLLEKELAEGNARQNEINKAAAGNPFKGLFILTYKSTGPIEHVFFHSTRQAALIQRDCQIYCRARGIRYISYKPALINLFAPTDDTTVNGNQVPAGDITELVTRQSREGIKFAGADFRDNSPI